MTVYDRWHLSFPQPGDKPCEHRDRVRGQLYPSADHGKGKRWQVRWYDEEGKQKKRYFDKKAGANPEIHADAFDADNTAKLNTGTYIDPAAGKVTLEAYAKQWLAAQTSDPSTLEILDRWYRNRIEGSAIGAKEMSFLAKRPSMIQQWVKGLEAGLGASTIGGALGILSAVFNAALDDAVVGRNPCRSSTVKAPKVPERKITPLTLDQLEGARGAMPPRYRAMVDLGFGAAMRQGEVLAIAKDDIGFLTREVKVLRQLKIIERTLIFGLPKGGKTRTVPIDDDTLLRLAAHLEEFDPVEVTLPWGRPDGPERTFALLFYWDGQRYKGAVRRDQINPLWGRARVAAGIPVSDETGMHLLRHTAASAWLAGGVDILKVAAWLGHADPAFTLRTYTHFMPDTEDAGRKAMKAFRKTKIDGPSALEVP